MTKPELLMPAGDLEKAKIAYQFGADACYGSTSAFSMRTREIGFDYQTLREAIDYAHSIGKKFYVTLNTYPHEFELPKIKAHAKRLIAMQPDAIIVADAGILTIVKEQLTRYKVQGTNKSQILDAKQKTIKQYNNKSIEIHLSTQANATNSEAIKFWASQGISRIILARELSLAEIAKIRKAVPKKVMVETFVHGAMCNSVSGRCNLSNYLSNRDANRGACVQPCRWKYALVEEKRPGQYIPVEEDESGSYIYNSRDLSMIEHLNEMSKAGIGSFKVEGRNKSIYYAAIVARSYRQAIDNLDSAVIASKAKQSSNTTINQLSNQDKKYFEVTDKKLPKKLKNELDTVTNRGYSTGFYFGKPTDANINYDSSRPTSAWQFVGIVKEASNYQLASKSYLIEARNEIFPGTAVEIVTPNEIIKLKLNKFNAPGGGLLEKVNPNTLFVLKTKKDLPVNSMLRRKI